MYEEVDGAYAKANDAFSGLEDLEKRLTKVIGDIPPLEDEEEGDQEEELSDEEEEIAAEEEDAVDHGFEDYNGPN